MHQFIRNTVNYLWYCKGLNSIAASMLGTQVQFRSQLNDLLLFPGGRAAVSMTTAHTTEVCNGPVKGDICHVI
jgi:hypothetical protein